MAKVIYLSGKGFWLHRLFEIDEYEGNRFWSLRIYPDPKSMRAYVDSDLKHKIKEDEEGKFITFKRNEKKPWKLKDKESPTFDPPEVKDADGKLWDEANMIGNGSEITIKLDTYLTRKGRFARLEGVRVDNWVRYEAPSDDQVVPDEDKDDSIRPF